jgi:hypothetical protein
LWATGNASARLIPGATGDLIFAALFARWLQATAVASVVAADR